MTGAGPVTRGSVVQATLEFLRREGGEELVVRTLGRLPGASARALTARGPTDDVPYADMVALWRAADAELGTTAPGWSERAGAWSIESLGAQLYGGILRKESPVQFLTQSVSLFRLYYHPGDMVPVEVAERRAVLRLVGFPALDRLFCERQRGGLRRSLELAGGLDASVRHVRCTLEGDAFCEWELRWR